MPRRRIILLRSCPDREGFTQAKHIVRRPLHGFTLVEMLVVIAIIGMLIGLLLPAINSARESARRTQCSNSLVNIVKAMINYESANRCFPPGRMGCDAFGGSPCQNLQPAQTPGTSAFLAILPQLDESPLYSTFTPFAYGAVYPGVSSGSWTNAAILASLQVRPTLFVCPSDNALPNNNFLNPPTVATSYALVMGELGANPIIDANGNTLQPAATELYQKYYNNGPFIYLTARRSADVRDGLSTTLFVGETTNGNTQATMNSWPVSVAYLSCMRSTNNLVNTPAGTGAMVTITSDSGLTGLPSTALGAFNSNHPQGANFAYGDGHVSYIGNMIDLPTYQALSTIAGAETLVPSDWWK